MSIRPALTPEQLADQRAHWHDDRRPMLYASTALFGCIAVVAVVLRFVARWRLKAKIKIDDWLIVVALVRLEHKIIIIRPFH